MKNRKEIDDRLYKDTIKPYKTTIDDLIYKYVNTIKTIATNYDYVEDVMHNKISIDYGKGLGSEERQSIGILSSVVLDLLKVKK